MAAQNKVQAVALSIFNSASITTSYQIINTGGLSAACFLIRVVNASDENIIISYDGVTDNEVVLSDSAVYLDFQANAQPTGWTSLLAKGTVVYAKGTAGTGTIYLSGYYIAQ
jgi:hypothetical protein